MPGNPGVPFNSVVKLPTEPSGHGGGRVPVTRVGFYIETPAAEFIEWLEAWTQLDHQAAYAVGQGRVFLGPAQRRVLMSQHLVMEVPGTLSHIQDIPDDISFPVSFQVLPVGLGSSVEVIGGVDIQELVPYLVDLVSAATSGWPQSAANAWFGEPPCRPVELCALTIPTSVPTLERELSRFAADYSTPEIRSLSFLPTTDAQVASGAKQSIHRQARWDLRLSLHTDGTWQGIDHVDLECDISRAPGKQPLTLTLRCHGFPYKEIEPFTAAVIAFCRSKWDITRVLRLADQPITQAASDFQKKRTSPGQYAEQQWTLADRPWELVADVAWDRLLVELWWKQSTAVVIGKKVSVTAKTVVNRLYELRKIYGRRIVPTEAQRRGRGEDKLGYPG